MGIQKSTSAPCGGPTERFAADRLASLVWAALDRTDKSALQAFLDEFPKAAGAADAGAMLDAILAREAEARAAAERSAKETAEWAAVAGSTNKAEVEAFLRAWPGGAHAADAKGRLWELRRAAWFSRRTLLLGAALGIGGTAGAGALAYLASVPGTLVWRLLHDQSILTFIGHANEVRAVAFAPDRRTALSGSGDDTLKLWDVATGRELSTFAGHASTVTAAVFAPDGRTALSGSGDTTLKLWDIATGRELRTFIGHAGWSEPSPSHLTVALPCRAAMMGR